MLDFSETTLGQVIVHFVGGEQNDEIFLSDECFDSSNELLNNLLRDYFLGHFKGNTGFYSFGTPESNAMYLCCTSLFDGSRGFQEVSCSIAEHLKKVSTHPNIKDGELFVTQLHNCIVDGEMADAIGIFKSESKDSFIKTKREGNKLTVSCEFGVNPKRLDKGCLVFQTESEFGYKLCVIDNTNRNEARFWVDDFLNATLRNDDFYQTKTTIDLCKNFVKEVITPNNNHPKLEQAELLQKTHDFFKSNETFEQDSFENSVISQPDDIEAFREYKKSYEAEMGYQIPDTFAISTDATKQAKRFFKSCIKLDKNFHIYIHGNHERVEKGFDKTRNLNFYKLYFDNEN